MKVHVRLLQEKELQSMLDACVMLVQRSAPSMNPLPLSHKTINQPGNNKKISKNYYIFSIHNHTKNIIVLCQI